MTTERFARKPGDVNPAASTEAEHDDEAGRPSVFRSKPVSSTHPKLLADVSAEQPARTKWIVVEKFAQDGHEYRLMRRPMAAKSELARLTAREEEVLEYASEGHTNKSIAYTLGLSPSTVGVLLSRAAARLGAKSRDELLSIFADRKEAARRTL